MVYLGHNKHFIDESKHTFCMAYLIHDTSRNNFNIYMVCLGHDQLAINDSSYIFDIVYLGHDKILMEDSMHKLTWFL